MLRKSLITLVGFAFIASASMVAAQSATPPAAAEEPAKLPTPPEAKPETPTETAKPPAEAKAPTDVFKFNRSDSIPHNLYRHKGKTIEVVLKSGKSITGKLKEVGDHLIYIEQLQGREFFDALVQTSQISAVIMRARTG